jgi:hypothetical protein
MKRVYIQIIDPINSTCVNACHEYPDEYNQAVEATLRYYNLSADEDYEAMGETGHEIPGMPNYLLVHGLERGTSKLVNITVVGQFLLRDTKLT